MRTIHLTGKNCGCRGTREWLWDSSVWVTQSWGQLHKHTAAPLWSFYHHWSTKNKIKRIPVRFIDLLLYSVFFHVKRKKKDLNDDVKHFSFFFPTSMSEVMKRSYLKNSIRGLSALFETFHRRHHQNLLYSYSKPLIHKEKKKKFRRNPQLQCHRQKNPYYHYAECTNETNALGTQKTNKPKRKHSSWKLMK